MCSSEYETNPFPALNNPTRVIIEDITPNSPTKGASGIKFKNPTIKFKIEPNNRKFVPLSTLILFGFSKLESLNLFRNCLNLIYPYRISPNGIKINI